MLVMEGVSKDHRWLIGIMKLPGVLRWNCGQQSLTAFTWWFLSPVWLRYCYLRSVSEFQLFWKISLALRNSLTFCNVVFSAYLTWLWHLEAVTVIMYRRLWPWVVRWNKVIYRAQKPMGKELLMHPFGGKGNAPQETLIRNSPGIAINNPSCPVTNDDTLCERKLTWRELFSDVAAYGLPMFI